MGTSEKLRPTSPALLVLVVSLLVVLMLFVFASGEQNFQILLLVVMGVASVVHLVLLASTGNPAYIVSFLFYLIAAMVPVLVLTGNRQATLWTAGAAMILFAAFIGLLVSGRIRWYHRDVLELAARPVETAGDGFTPRPWPAGTTGAGMEQIREFALFLKKQGIAVPYEEEDGLVIAVPENILRSFFLPWKGYEGMSYVAFGFDGTMSVNISEKDYRKFKEELTFDQLCASFADLFRSLLDDFAEGRRDHILERLRKRKDR